MTSLFDRESRAPPGEDRPEPEDPERLFVTCMYDDDDVASLDDGDTKGIIVDNSNNNSGNVARGGRESADDVVVEQGGCRSPPDTKKEATDRTFSETETGNEELDDAGGDDDGPGDVEERQFERRGPPIDPRSDERPLKTREEVEEENRRLREELAAREAQVRVLTESMQSNNNSNNPSPVRIQLVLAFLAGFFGWNPPLWLDLKAALRWNDRDPNTSDDAMNSRSAPTPIDRIRQGSKLFFFCCVFFVDFADAVLDVLVSIQTIRDVPEEDEPKFERWAYGLLVATGVARTLGGMFAALCQQCIDKSNREMSYFVVELTIWFVEDFYAAYFLMLKRTNGIPWTTLDSANHYTTIICFVLLVVPFLRHHKKFRKAFTPVINCAILLYYECVFIFAVVPLFLMVFFGAGLGWVTVFSDYGLQFRLQYSIQLTVQLYVLYRWIRYLQDDPRDRANRRQARSRQSWLTDQSSVVVGRIIAYISQHEPRTRDR